MRVPPAEYLRLNLRAHDLLRDVPLYDVSVVDLRAAVPDGALLVYRFPGEALRFICTALARTVSGYRLYWGIYLIPVSWLTRPS